MELKVYDMFGREVLYRLIGNKKEDVELDVSFFDDGLYLVVFYLNDEKVCGGSF